MRSESRNQRIEAVFKSGLNAWVYVEARINSLNEPKASNIKPIIYDNKHTAVNLEAEKEYFFAPAVNR